jgi:hypothetical protein
MSALESPCCELQHNETQQQHLLLSFVQPAWCYKEFTSLHLPSLIDVVPQLQTRHRRRTTDFYCFRMQRRVLREEGRKVNWRARRDSNSRPIAPEAIALSS